MCYHFVYPADTKDYVWSTWNEGQLRHYLEEKGIVDTPAQAKKNDLLAAVKKTYTDTADNVYDTWSDSYLVSWPDLSSNSWPWLTLPYLDQKRWLVQHGVGHTKQAKTRNDLLDLMSKNYYSARDTTWNSWSDSQLRNWAISRGLIDSKAKSTRKESVCTFPPFFSNHNWRTNPLLTCSSPPRCFLFSEAV